jgi:hypothetical protein
MAKRKKNRKWGKKRRTHKRSKRYTFKKHWYVVYGVKVGRGCYRLAARSGELKKGRVHAVLPRGAEGFGSCSSKGPSGAIKKAAAALKRSGKVTVVNYKNMLLVCLKRRK